MNRDESNFFTATLTGSRDIIFREGDESFGLANFGKPTYSQQLQLKGKGRSKSAHSD